MSPDTIKIISGPEFALADGTDGAWMVEGYASTPAVDAYNEIVSPEAFRRSLPAFHQFPVLLLNHAWFDRPVGAIRDAEIRSDGLWVRAEISKTAPEVWGLIQERILKAFSIGFNARTIQRGRNGEPDTLLDIDLLEISVVNVPANREALFAVANAKGMDLSRFYGKAIVPQSHTHSGGDGMNSTIPDVTVSAAGDVAKNVVPEIMAAARTEATLAAKGEVARVEMKCNDLVGQLAEIQRSVKACATEAEFLAMKDKVVGDVSTITAQLQRLSATGIGPLDDRLSTVSGRGYDAKAIFYRSVAEEMNAPVQYVKCITNRPEDLSRYASVQGLARKWQQMHDELYLLDCIARTARPFNYNGARSLKMFDAYAELTAEFRKALDTATTEEGTEWIPTNMSASMIDRMALTAAVAGLFPSFVQPTKSYTWPVKGTRGTAYLTAENIADAGTKITASTPQTLNVTFTAVQLAMRLLSSSEFWEDTIVPALPFMMDEIADTLAHGIDDAILNGDTSASHQDSDVTDAADRRKAWSGLRYKALANATSKVATTTCTVANLVAIWRLLGNFGGNPSKLAFIMTADDYIYLMQDSNIISVANFGDSRATVIGGAITSVFGIKVIVSDDMRGNVNASGVYDGTTTTKSTLLCVHTPSFMVGDRRIVTLETDKDIETQQMIAVGTCRKDFKQMLAGAAGAWPMAIGYNMA